MRPQPIYLNYTPTGERIVWTLYREGRYWFLRDHSAYVRTLSPTLAESIPRVRMIADNHGCTITAGL